MLWIYRRRYKDWSATVIFFWICSEELRNCQTLWEECVYTLLTLWTWFLSVSHTQWPCFGLFSVSVVPLWCIHILMIDWKETFVSLANFSHIVITFYCLHLNHHTDRTHSGCVGRSWQRCWWAQMMCRCLFSCSSVLPAAWLLPPLYR